MTVTGSRGFTIMIILALVLPGCARQASAPAPRDPPAQTEPEQRPAVEPAEDGEEGRKLDLDVDVEIGDSFARVG